MRATALATVMLAAVGLPVCAYAGSGGADEESKRPNKVELTAIDLSIPTQPAAHLLGVDPSEVKKPSNLREALVTAINSTDRRGNLQQGFGFAFTGWRAQRFRGTAEEFVRERIDLDWEFSLAAVKGASENDKSAKLGLGVSRPLVDETRPFRDEGDVRDYFAAVDIRTSTDTRALLLDVQEQLREATDTKSEVVAIERDLGLGTEPAKPATNAGTSSGPSGREVKEGTLGHVELELAGLRRQLGSIATRRGRIVPQDDLIGPALEELRKRRDSVDKKLKETGASLPAAQRSSLKTELSELEKRVSSLESRVAACDRDLSSLENAEKVLLDRFTKLWSAEAQEELKRLTEERWNARALSLAAGLAWVSPTGLTQDFRSDRYGVWLRGANPMGKNGQLLYAASYRDRETVPDPSNEGQFLRQNTWFVGARYLYGSATNGVSLEVSYSIENPEEGDSERMRTYLLGWEQRLTKDHWLQLSVGTEDDRSTGDQLLFGFSYNIGLGNKAQIARPGQ